MPNAPALMIGFSIGVALLLALAFATAYRRVELPLQSRLFVVAPRACTRAIFARRWTDIKTRTKNSERIIPWLALHADPLHCRKLLDRPLAIEAS